MFLNCVIYLSSALVIAASRDATCDITIEQVNWPNATMLLQTFVNQAVVSNAISGTVCFTTNIPSQPFLIGDINVPSNFSLTVIGDSMASTFLTGPGNHVCMFNSNGGNLTLMNLNISFGEGLESVIFNQFGYLLVDRVYFSGGTHAVYANVFRMVLSNCIFEYVEGCSAPGEKFGGAVLAIGLNQWGNRKNKLFLNENNDNFQTGSSVIVSECMFLGCSCFGPGGDGVGGALAILEFDESVIDSCTFTGNSAGEGVGGVAIISNSLVVRNSTFSDNSWENGGRAFQQYGDALSFSGNVLSVSSSYFGNNSDQCGGFLAASCTCNTTFLSNVSCFTITDTVFEYNTVGKNVCGVRARFPLPPINATVLYSGGAQTMPPPVLTRVIFKDNWCPSGECANVAYITSILPDPAQH